MTDTEEIINGLHELDDAIADRAASLIIRLSAETEAFAAINERQDQEYARLTAEVECRKLTVYDLKNRTDPVWVDVPDSPLCPNGRYYCLCDNGLITPPSLISFRAGERDWNFYTCKPNTSERSCAKDCGEKPIADGDKGLYVKYNVTKTDTGEVVHDCFVLRPDRDHAAVTALRAYATATENRTLADDIVKWVGAENGGEDGGDTK